MCKLVLFVNPIRSHSWSWFMILLSNCCGTNRPFLEFTDKAVVLFRSLDDGCLLLASWNILNHTVQFSAPHGTVGLRICMKAIGSEALTKIFLAEWRLKRSCSLSEQHHSPAPHSFNQLDAYTGASRVEDTVESAFRRKLFYPLSRQKSFGFWTMGTLNFHHVAGIAAKQLLRSTFIISYISIY